MKGAADGPQRRGPCAVGAVVPDSPTWRRPTASACARSPSITCHALTIARLRSESRRSTGGPGRGQVARERLLVLVHELARATGPHSQCLIQASERQRAHRLPLLGRAQRQQGDADALRYPRCDSPTPGVRRWTAPCRFAGVHVSGFCTFLPAPVRWASPVPTATASCAGVRPWRRTGKKSLKHEHAACGRDRVAGGQAAALPGGHLPQTLACLRSALRGRQETPATARRPRRTGDGRGQVGPSRARVRGEQRGSLASRRTERPAASRPERRSRPLPGANGARQASISRPPPARGRPSAWPRPVGPRPAPHGRPAQRDHALNWWRSRPDSIDGPTARSPL